MSVTKIAISGPPTQFLHSAFCLLTFAFTGCTTLVTTFNRSSKTVEDGFNRIRAGMTNQETDEESTYYGAFFIWPRSSSSGEKAEGKRKKAEVICLLLD